MNREKTEGLQGVFRLISYRKAPLLFDVALLLYLIWYNHYTKQMFDRNNEKKKGGFVTAHNRRSQRPESMKCVTGGTEYAT